jgi:hypothetical protein
MAVVDTTNSFSNNEQITSTKLNEIMDNSFFVSDAVVSGQGLSITAGGKMQIPNGGITTALIADSNVTSAKLASSITVTSLSAGAISATGNIRANAAIISSGGISTTGDITVGAGTSRSDVSMLIGWNRTVAGTSNLYFYSDVGGTIDASIQRASGTNGAIQINNNGTGNFLNTGSTRYGYNTASPTNTHHFSGGIRNTSPNAAGTGSYLVIDANGDIKALGSSLRYKNSIEDYNKGLKELKQLRPVTYKFNGEDVVTAGFIAEEVDAIGMDEYVIKNSEGQPDALNYGQMVALLVNAIKEQQQQIDELKAKVQ